MPHKTLSPTYSRLQRTLHWTVAGLIVVLIALGFYIESQPYSPFVGKMYTLHKSLGIIVLLLAIIRLLKRINHKVAPIAAPRWQKIAAHTSHGLLYTLMVLMPLSGWAMSSADGYAVPFFGLFNLPELVEKNKELGAFYSDVHGTMAWVLIGLVSMHILAALHHHLIRKNDTLRRMLGRA